MPGTPSTSSTQPNTNHRSRCTHQTGQRLNKHLAERINRLLPHSQNQAAPLSQGMLKGSMSKAPTHHTCPAIGNQWKSSLG
eukprot:197776-Amphidinium_carterae.2